MLKKTLAVSSLLHPGLINELMAESSVDRLRIGACDWSLGKGSNIEAFKIAKSVGLEGIMVDMGSEQNNLHIRQREIQRSYLKESAQTGIAISSLALGIYNRVPFHSDSRVQEWLRGSIDAAKNLKVKVVLIAFFNASDLRNDESRKAIAIEHLKSVMPYAEKKGIILGIESYLNAKEHMEIIDSVKSKNLKVYFDFRNTADAGYDPIAEFRKLGKDMVCELHMKENGFLLGQGTIDWPGVSEAVQQTGYIGSGWMQIEGAVPKGGDIVESYRHNLTYLRKLFNK